MIERGEEFRKDFNEKYAKKLKKKGLLTKKNMLLIEILISIGMLNKDIILDG